MAEVNLKVKVEAGKNFFHFYDKTGSYDKNKNPNGWNGPNNQISSVSNAVVRVYLPKQDNYTEVVVFPNLPRTDCVGMEIIPEDISLDSFPPGVYRFEYVITFQNGYEIAESKYLFHIEPLCCCVEKRRAKTDLKNPSSDLTKKYMEMAMLLDNVQYAACAGRMDEAQEICDSLWTKCGCCC
jgi:hypothetical protein